jgi:hypothetical protein
LDTFGIPKGKLLTSLVTLVQDGSVLLHDDIKACFLLRMYVIGTALVCTTNISMYLHVECCPGGAAAWSSATFSRLPSRKETES